MGGVNDAELLKFINETEEHYYVEAPKNLKESVMARTGALPERAACEARRISKNMQLFLYSMKVCTAVLAVLLFLNFSHTINTLHGGGRGFTRGNGREIEIASVIAEKTTVVSGTLRTLSDELLNLGGIFDD